MSAGAGQLPVPVRCDRTRVRHQVRPPGVAGGRLHPGEVLRGPARRADPGGGVYGGRDRVPPQDILQLGWRSSISFT